MAYTNTGTAWKTQSGALVRLRNREGLYGLQWSWRCDGCTNESYDHPRKHAEKDAAAHARTCGAVQA